MKQGGYNKFGVQELFQDIVYFLCGNKNIMISKNIMVAIAQLSPLPRSPWLNRKNCWGIFDGF